jgi:DNA-binding transcriptional MerR regulator
MTGSISPSQAAEQSGFSLDTLRYYERIGLLDDIGRAPSGHRRFRDEDLEWLGVLRCLRDTGMPIAQMRRYAELARGGEPTMTERLDLLIEHDAEVGRRIAALRAEQAHLQEKIGWYRSQLQADNASDPVLLHAYSFESPRADSAWACIACGNAGSGGGQRKDPNLCGHSSPGACGCGCCWPSPCR